MEETPDRRERPMPAWERRLRERRRQTTDPQTAGNTGSTTAPAAVMELPAALDCLRAWLQHDPSAVAARLQDARNDALRQELLRFAHDLGNPPRPPVA